MNSVSLSDVVVNECQHTSYGNNDVVGLGALVIVDEAIVETVRGCGEEVVGGV